MYYELLKFFIPQTPYNIVNKNNIYNFIIANFELIRDDKKEDYIKNIKLIIGMSFTKQLKYYLYEKDNKSDLLKYI